MGLAWQVTVTWFSERRARPRGCLLQQLVEAGARYEQKPVRRAGAGHCEATERRVELVQFGSAGERVDRDGDAVGLPLPGVDG